MNWNVEGPVSKRNQLTQRQTQALIKLWEKWGNNSNQKLNRLAYSPNGGTGYPYIVIERRDDLLDKMFKWDWCITYYGDAGPITSLTWRSDSKEPMPDLLKTFLRKAYDREFMSIHQTSL